MWKWTGTDVRRDDRGIEYYFRTEKHTVTGEFRTVKRRVAKDRRAHDMEHRKIVS